MGKKDRVKQGIKYGMIDTVAVMFVGLVLMEILAVPFTSIFGLSGQTQDMCISAMRVVSVSMLFAGANVAFQGIFQALDGGIESLVISVCRQFLFVIPVAWGLSFLVNESASNMWVVWITFIITEGLSAVIAWIFMKRINKKKIDVMK